MGSVVRWRSSAPGSGPRTASPATRPLRARVLSAGGGITAPRWPVPTAPSTRPPSSSVTTPGHLTPTGAPSSGRRSLKQPTQPSEGRVLTDPALVRARREIALDHCCVKQAPGSRSFARLKDGDFSAPEFGLSGTGIERNRGPSGRCSGHGALFESSSAVQRLDDGDDPSARPSIPLYLRS